MRKFVLLFICGILSQISFSEESWIVPCDDLVYRQAEELFLNAGQVPPLEELPMIADDLRFHLKKLIDDDGIPAISNKAFELYHDLRLPLPNISPIVEVGFSGFYNSEPGRLHYIPTYDGNDYTGPPFDGADWTPATLDMNMTDFTYFYEINEIPTILKLGFIAQFAGFSLLMQPQLRAANSYLLGESAFMNIMTNPVNIDNNFPYRGIAAFYKEPVEFRIGRDKLHLGPSRKSPLLITKYMPYFDFVKARFFYEWFSLSSYFIRLNPTITAAESYYLDQMYNDPVNHPNPEGNAAFNGLTYNERSKNYIVAKLVITPFPWLMLDITQTNLVGGREPELQDFNPLILFHNLFEEGVYSVPLNISATYVPYRGIRLYIDYLFYDAAVGDEADPGENPGAAAYQAGFTVLSDPFFKLGPGRFRLDSEVTLTDPWVYGKYYDFRKFTSRIIYVESFVGRMWVDYPLGFYLGPDCLDINVSLSYGEPGKWEAGVSWNRSGLGMIDLYGWGYDNDYTHTGEPGYPLSGAPTSSPTTPVQWTDILKFDFYYVPFPGLELSAWYQFKFVQNRFHIAGSDAFSYLGLQATLKIF
ncbi:MAG: hypothetical protein JW969_00820 [Spirochaetales bacterium]|nr:hypothetical protein [Spirochaetales bacterium]